MSDGTVRRINADGNVEDDVDGDMNGNMVVKRMDKFFVMGGLRNLSIIKITPLRRSSRVNPSPKAHLLDPTIEYTWLCGMIVRAKDSAGGSLGTLLLSWDGEEERKSLEGGGEDGSIHGIGISLASQTPLRGNNSGREQAVGNVGSQPKDKVGEPRIDAYEKKKKINTEGIFKPVILEYAV
ncbi:hypothetical protein BC829DRAFT_412848 [Chytridium lagenaria]|nr:hypothetical protein BC829DRAFT_412848 [Chytridium lagenaria]